MPHHPVTYAPEKLVLQRILPLICTDCAISVSQGVMVGRLSAKSADALAKYLGLHTDDILMSGPGCRSCHLGCRGREAYHAVEFGDASIEVFEGAFRLAGDHPSQDLSVVMPLALERVSQGKFCITHVEAAHGLLTEWIESRGGLLHP